MARALLFAVTGIAFFASWFFENPATLTVEDMQQWPHVLWFSATLATLAIALAVFGRMVGGRLIVRFATAAGAVVGAASIVNVFEDGIRIEGLFLVFVLCLLIIHATLIGLAVAIVRSTAGPGRLLALVPALTSASILLFPVVGGPIMLAAWLGAAGVALARSSSAPTRAATPTAS